MEPCSDCFHEKVCIHKANIQNGTYGYMRMEYDINKCQHYTPASSEDKEVKHGEWLMPDGELSTFKNRYVICSVCNVMLPVIPELYFYSFCPKCGAKMKR